MSGRTPDEQIGGVAPSQWINHYLVDSAVHFVSTHPLDSYLCIEYRYAPLEQLGSVI